MRTVPPLKCQSIARRERRATGGTGQSGGRASALGLLYFRVQPHSVVVTTAKALFARNALIGPSAGVSGEA